MFGATFGGRVRNTRKLPRVLVAAVFLLTVLTAAFAPFSAPKAGASDLANLSRVYFNETSHYLANGFLSFYRSHGGYASFGAPISEELTENGHTVQYFQKTRFEYHTELKGTAWETSLGLLGAETLRLQGNPLTQGNPWATIVPVANTATQTYFAQTKHSVSGAFKTYWEAKGGLFRFGYPISQSYNWTTAGKITLAQDFERSRLILFNGTIYIYDLGYNVAYAKNVNLDGLPHDPNVLPVSTGDDI